MPTYQAGQPRLATITLTEADASTDASVKIIAPDDTETTIGASPVTGTDFLEWEADSTYVLTEGETIERWTVTGTGATSGKDNLVWADATANSTVTGQRVYATSADYAKLIKPSTPPTGLRAKLEAASRLVDEMLLCAVYAVDDDKMPTDTAVIAAIRDATCLQAEFAIGTGDAQMVGAVKGSGFSLGRLSVQTPAKAKVGEKGGGGPRGEWAPRAWARLAQEAGLIGSPQDWGSWGVWP